jgi:geranylgeranyl diphosphate synthase type II
MERMQMNENRMRQFEEELNDKIRDVEQMLEKALPAEEGLQKTIFSAMRYSLMAGGKRLRPLLIQETYRFFGGDDLSVVTPFMAAIEMIHTYSLIHDDLPALDNDDYRRGRLTSHKVYGEAMGILAGDALLNYAFETASGAFDQTEDTKMLRRIVKAMQILSRKPGVYGMIGGQVVDVELTGCAIPEETLRFIFELKTGALIEACMMIGACLAGACEDQIALIEKAAHHIGMAFQIQDDILDVTSSTEVLGKPVHSDEKNEKTTWVTLYGLEKAREDVVNYSEEAMSILTHMQGITNAEETFLYTFVAWLIQRKK